MEVSDVISFNGALQVNVKRVRKCAEGEYDEKEYMPISKRDLDEMYKELTDFIATVENPYLNTLLNNIFVNDTAFAWRFKKASAAKSVHHGFIGGLLEHTLGVVKLCDYYCSAYPMLNRDLLITAAICHDMGKTKEISAFPMNDYTDEGQFLGHIVIGSEMIGERVRQIEGFPPMLEMELKHCILSHHGEYEYGSPKKPAIMEAVALNFADNTDAKMETFMELLESTKETGWLGFNKLFDSNLRGTQV
jgi:3'-5' exoribonuclease